MDTKSKTNLDKDPIVDSNDIDEDWHDQLLQLNTDVAMDFVKQNLEISHLESYCNAKEELLNELKLQVTSLEGEVNLKEQELKYLQEKEKLLNGNLNTLNEMVNSKEETEELINENQRLRKSKRERMEKEWKQISTNYNNYIKQLRETFEKNPLAEKRNNLQINVLKERINLMILNQKVRDQKENIKMLQEIRKREEQVKIIKFASQMVEYNEIQKMRREIIDYEKKFKEIKNNNKFTNKEFLRKDNIFKVPQQKPLSSFQIPNLNLSSYRVNTQFVPKKIPEKGYNTNYSLNKSVDDILSKLNKRNNQSFLSGQKQKKIKTTLSLPTKLFANNCEKSTPEVVKSFSQTEDIFEYTSQPNNENAELSQIISFGTTITQKGKTMENVSGDYNDNTDLMETSSFALEEFVSPTRPLKDIENISEPSNNTFFNSLFDGATKQDKSKNVDFSFLNTTPKRKKSSQNIFSMF